MDPTGLVGTALPAPLPFPSPASHPVFQPGTSANDQFTEETIRVLRGAERWVNKAGEIIGESWEEIKPKPQEPLKPYDENVDYNPSHHNPNVKINDVEGPIYSKQRKKNRQSRLGGDDPFWHIPEAELDKYIKSGSDTEQKRAADIKRMRKKKAQGHNRLDGRH